MTVLQLAPWISQLSQSQGGEKGPGIDQMLTRTLQGQVGPVGPRGSTGKYSVYTVYIYEKKKKINSTLLAQTLLTHQHKFQLQYSQYLFFLVITNNNNKN